MSADLLRSALEAHAASGAEGLCITVIRKGKVFGVDVHPGWEKDLKERGFQLFAAMVLEPAFVQIQQMAEDLDG
jgi:hypothetical protein